ncbi:MAG: hypothetical protein H0S85_13995 [Desulfovibrionaceae bacterium]|jgi:hypothetical protein|nr:hypothetical protein [Desulfovibrionaceae bacterium]
MPGTHDDSPANEARPNESPTHGGPTRQERTDARTGDGPPGAHEDSGVGRDILLGAYCSVQLEIPKSILTISILIIGTLATFLATLDNLPSLVANGILLFILASVANVFIILYSYRLTAGYLLRMIKGEDHEALVPWIRGIERAVIGLFAFSLLGTALVFCKLFL